MAPGADVYHPLSHVTQWQYFVDDRYTGELYLDFDGMVAFKAPGRDYTPWHGEWCALNTSGGLKIYFDPDHEPQESEEVNISKWSYLAQAEMVNGMSPCFQHNWYGIDYLGREVKGVKRVAYRRCTAGNYSRWWCDVAADGSDYHGPPSLQCWSLQPPPPTCLQLWNV